MVMPAIEPTARTAVCTLEEVQTSPRVAAEVLAAARAVAQKRDRMSKRSFGISVQQQTCDQSVGNNEEEASARMKVKLPSELYPTTYLIMLNDLELV